MSAMLERLLETRSLDEAEARSLFDVLADPDTPPALSGAYLAALRTKGESADELYGLVMAMRARANPCALAETKGLADVVGTGGDHAGSFNLSTGSALLAAACGLPVVKHGSGAVSGKSGASDVLAALGISLARSDEDAHARFSRTGFAFLHAPSYHPALGGIGVVRRALATRTVFNLMGPLCNPSRPSFAVLGAASLGAARIMAEVASRLPFERVFVVHGAAGWDEPTPAGPFHVFDVRPGVVDYDRRDPRDAGLPKCELDDLRGGNATTNAAAMRRALSGEQGAHRDALVLGAALALEVSGRIEDRRLAVEEARVVIDDGRAGAFLDALTKEGGHA
jgi:anthranilate phosphoribosyltransferase